MKGIISAEHHAMLLVTLVLNDCTSFFMSVAFRIQLKVIFKDVAPFSFGIHYASLSIPEITCERAYVESLTNIRQPSKEKLKTCAYEVSTYMLQLMGNILLKPKCFRGI